METTTIKTTKQTEAMSDLDLCHPVQAVYFAFFRTTLWGCTSAGSTITIIIITTASNTTTTKWAEGSPHVDLALCHLVRVVCLVHWRTLISWRRLAGSNIIATTVTTTTTKMARDENLSHLYFYLRQLKIFVCWSSLAGSTITITATTTITI